MLLVGSDSYSHAFWPPEPKKARPDVEGSNTKMAIREEASGRWCPEAFAWCVGKPVMVNGILADLRHPIPVCMTSFRGGRLGCNGSCVLSDCQFVDNQSRIVDVK